MMKWIIFAVTSRLVKRLVTANAVVFMLAAGGLGPKVQARSLVVSSITPAGSSLVLRGSGGPASGSYYMLVSTSVALSPKTLWTRISTNVFAADGTFTNNVPINPALQAFFMIVAGADTISVSPRAAALTSMRTQQFTASLGGVTWSVDGVVGGSAAAGTITGAGLYTPPGNAGAHVVMATSPDQLQSGTAVAYVSSYPGTFTVHNDNFRTGQNLNERVLNPLNVAPATFGQLYSYPLDGQAYASPLYVANLNIPGQGFHNVVYVATEGDSVYAFDADGLTNGPLWQVSFTNSDAGIMTVPSGDTGEPNDLTPQIGITGTPVIDPGSGTLYVVAKTKEVTDSGTSYVQRLHALNITNGAEMFGGPVVIQASVTGSGDGSQGNILAFDPLRENQRAGLLLTGGVVYMGFAAHGDNSPWHGWLLGYNATNLQQQTVAYNPTPNGYGGGIWQSGAGMAADASNNIYFVTGNGPFDQDVGGGDYGDSVMRIDSTGNVLDCFTPHDQANLEAGDLDFGSAGVMLLPDQPGPNAHLMVTAGKGGTIYLLNRDNMGGYNTNDDSQIVQSLPNIFPNGTSSTGNYSSPVYFNGSIFYCAVDDVIKAFRLSNGLLSVAPTSQSPETFGFPGAAMAISANGGAGGILWAVEWTGSQQPGVLHAYDPANLNTELYNSNQAGIRDVMDYAAKFSIPLVANGKVFIGSEQQLTVFGLLP